MLVCLAVFMFELSHFIALSGSVLGACCTGDSVHNLNLCILHALQHISCVANRGSRFHIIPLCLRTSVCVSSAAVSPRTASRACVLILLSPYISLGVCLLSVPAICACCLCCAACVRRSYRSPDVIAKEENFVLDCVRVAHSHRDITALYWYVAIHIMNQLGFKLLGTSLYWILDVFWLRPWHLRCWELQQRFCFPTRPASDLQVCRAYIPCLILRKSFASKMFASKVAHNIMRRSQVTLVLLLLGSMFVPAPSLLPGVHADVSKHCLSHSVYAVQFPANNLSLQTSLQT